MNGIPIQNVAFDDAATSAMGEAFDRACSAVRSHEPASTVRETIANRILDAAKNGERNPNRLLERALAPFDTEDMPVTGFGADRERALAAYTSVAHAA